LASANSIGTSKNPALAQRIYCREHKYSAPLELKKEQWTSTPGFTWGYSNMALPEPIVIMKGAQKAEENLLMTGFFWIELKEGTIKPI
jgi:hypothetical protein